MSNQEERQPEKQAMSSATKWILGLAGVLIVGAGLVVAGLFIGQGLAARQAANTGYYGPMTGRGMMGQYYDGEAIPDNVGPRGMRGGRGLRGGAYTGGGAYPCGMVGPGVAQDCTWHGWLSRDAVSRLMEQSDVLAFPSLLEATSTTVMQALSRGLPVIALRHCGLEDVVNDTCGFSIPVQTVRSAVRGFSDALCQLVDDPPAVERLSRGSAVRARAHSWDRVARELDAAYRGAATGSSPSRGAVPSAVTRTHAGAGHVG